MTGLLFLCSFAFYLSGLSGTVPAYRDSGDLIASIHTFGIAHPPGYALYIVLGKCFEMLLPFGNVAYRANVFSAVGAASAVLVLYTALKRSSWNAVAAFGVCVLFVTSPAMMALARVAEMYALSTLIAAAILFFLFSESPDGAPRAALCLGLGLSVHPTLLFLVPLFFMAPIQSVRRTLLFFVLGLAIFLYLPIRAAQHPLLNWGDPSNWRNFWRVVTRADYGGLKLHPGQSVFSWTPGSVVAQLSAFVMTFKNEWGWGAILAGAMGVVAGLKSAALRPRTLGLLISFVLSGPAFFLLSNLPLHEATTPAILQPYLLLSGVLWAPLVVMGLLSAYPARRGIVLVFTLLMWATRPWSFPSQRYDFYAYDYARNLLRSLPPNAVLYEPDDPTHFSIQVLQTAEHRRTDVVLLNFFRTRWGYEQIKRQWPDLLPPIPIDNGPELQRLFWSYSALKRPFYAELPQKFTEQGIPYLAVGLAYAAQPYPGEPPSPGGRPGAPQFQYRAQSRFVTGGTASAEGEVFQRAETLFQLYVMRGDFNTTHHPDFFTRHLVDYYAAAHCNLGLDYANAKKGDKAVGHYQAALAINPELSAAYNDWGILAFNQKHYAEAARLFQKGLDVDPGNENLKKNAGLALQNRPN